MTGVWIRQLRLFQFRSHASRQFTFQPGISAFTGPNGIGKTNILEALHCMALTRSFLPGSEQLAIREGEDHCRIAITASIDERDTDMDLTLAVGKRKLIRHGEEKVTRLRDHYGLIPFVFVGPSDISLISGGSEERRRFLDMAIGQVDSIYLDALHNYNKALDARNALLKNGHSNSTLFEALQQQMLNYGKTIADARKQFIERIKPETEQFYQQLADDSEHVSLAYAAQHEPANWELVWQRELAKDMATGRTNSGVHRDDLAFHIKGQSLRYQGSQGQQKSFLLALKLAQWKHLATAKNAKPILALDDVFERLDVNRTEALMRVLGDLQPTQLFLTDSQAERTNHFASIAGMPFQVFSV